MGKKVRNVLNVPKVKTSMVLKEKRCSSTAVRWDSHCFSIGKNKVPEDQKVAGIWDEKLRKLDLSGVLCMVFVYEIKVYNPDEDGKVQQAYHHIQGYVRFKSKWTPQRVKDWLECDFAHLEKRRGTEQQAWNYCFLPEPKHEGGVSTHAPGYTPFTFGSPSKGQGARTDLVEAWDDIKQGRSMFDLIEDNPGQYARNHRVFEKMSQEVDARRPQVWKQKIVVMNVGSTGSGKTRPLYDDEAGREVTKFYRKTICSSADKWFDGYKRDIHDIVLIDDYRGEWEFPFLLQVLDGYPLQLPVKGSFVWFQPKEIHITSNVWPWDWYKPVKTESAEEYAERMSPLLRRIYIYEHLQNLRSSSGGGCSVTPPQLPDAASVPEVSHNLWELYGLSKDQGRDFFDFCYLCSKTTSGREYRMTFLDR